MNILLNVWYMRGVDTIYYLLWCMFFPHHPTVVLFLADSDWMSYKFNSILTILTVSDPTG